MLNFFANKVNQVAGKSHELMQVLQGEIHNQTEQLSQLLNINNLNIQIPKPLLERQTQQIMDDIFQTMKKGAQLAEQQNRYHLLKINQITDLLGQVQKQIKQVNLIQSDILPNNTTTNMIQVVQKYDQVIHKADDLKQMLKQQINSMDPLLIGMANIINVTNNQPALINEEKKYFIEEPTQYMPTKQLYQESESQKMIQQKDQSFKVMPQIAKKIKDMDYITSRFKSLNLNNLF